jgi:hypothetical protein
VAALGQLGRLHIRSFHEITLNLLVEADKLAVDQLAYASYRVPEIVELIQAGRLSAESANAE